METKTLEERIEEGKKMFPDSTEQFVDRCIEGNRYIEMIDAATVEDSKYKMAVTLGKLKCVIGGMASPLRYPGTNTYSFGLILYSEEDMPHVRDFSKYQLQLFYQSGAEVKNKTFEIKGPYLKQYEYRDSVSPMNQYKNLEVEIDNGTAKVSLKNDAGEVGKTLEFKLD